MTEKALQAFEFGVLDFVPKPIKKERLEKALQKWKNAAANSRYTKFLSVRKEDKTEIISLKDISYIQHLILCSINFLLKSIVKRKSINTDSPFFI